MTIIYTIELHRFGGYEVRDAKGNVVLERYATWSDANKCAEAYFKR
jgi:hypothetical protein